MYGPGLAEPFGCCPIGGSRAEFGPRSPGDKRVDVVETFLFGDGPFKV